MTEILNSGTISGLLARWHALPLSLAEAQALLDRCHLALQDLSLPEMQRWWLGCQIMKAHFFFGRPCALEFEYLRGRAISQETEALLELLYGQLLLSRKCLPAMDHLQRGFALAANSLLARDYFRVLQRHRQLEDLVLGQTPATPATLAALLVESQVIRRLSGGATAAVRGAHDDTLG